MPPDMLPDGTTAIAVTLALMSLVAGCGQVESDGDVDGGVDASAGSAGAGGSGGTIAGSGGTIVSGGGGGGNAGSGSGGGSGGSGSSTGSGGVGGGSAGTGGLAGSSGSSGAGGGGGSGGSGVGGSGGEFSCATPTFSPAGGSYTVAQLVTVSTTTPGATIYYTTDGTNPNQNSAVYSSPIAITNTVNPTTLRAMCNALPAYTDSTVGFAVYTVVGGGSVVGPTPNPAAGTFDNDFLLSFTTTMAGGTICFTLEGSSPTCASGICQGTAQTYSSQTQVPINGNVTNTSTGAVFVNAVWCKAGTLSGVMPAQKYTLQVATPALSSPAPGQHDYDAANPIVTAALSSVTNGNVTARYTTAAGNPPTCSNGTLVSAALPTSWPIDTTQGNATYLIAACKPGYKDSAVFTASYTFKLRPPTFTPNGGSFAAPVAVTVGNAPNAGAAGVWSCTTSDGTAPACGAMPNTCAGTASSAGSILVDKDATTLRGIACGTTFLSSGEATSSTFSLTPG